MIVLAYIFTKVASLSEEQVRRARQWFWRTVFTEHYRGASEAFVSRDLEAIHQFVVDGGGKASVFGEAPDEHRLHEMLFRKNNSGSRAYSLALAKVHPRNITNGAYIDTDEALSVYNRAQFHHIWPQAFLKRNAPDAERNYLLNICMLAAEQNNKIGDADPREYLPELARNLGNDASPVFASNLLPDPASFPYGVATYEQFLLARAELAKSWFGTLCDGAG